GFVFRDPPGGGRGGGSVFASRGEDALRLGGGSGRRDGPGPSRPGHVGTGGDCRLDTGRVGAVRRPSRRASEGIAGAGATRRGSDPRWRVGSVSDRTAAG